MRIFLVIILISMVGALPVFAVTATPAPSPNPLKEIVTDEDCARSILTGSAIDSNNRPICNVLCQRDVLYDSNGTKCGMFCEYGSTSKPGSINGSNYLPGANYPIEASQADSVFIYIRAGLYAVMGLVGLGVILLGLYGWYLRAMSEGVPEKIEESFKIYKNAILGAIIVFTAGAAVQIIFVFMGITDNVLNFNLIPKYGYTVEVYERDIGRFCFDTQVDKSNIGGSYICKDNKWVKQ